MVDVQEMPLTDDPVAQTGDYNLPITPEKTTDIELEPTEAAKVAVMEQIESSGYAKELREALSIAAEGHFTSSETPQQTLEPEGTGVIVLMDKLWSAFNDYKDYRKDHNNPLEGEVEENFRTVFIFKLIKIMLDGDKTHQQDQIKLNHAGKNDLLLEQEPAEIG